MEGGIVHRLTRSEYASFKEVPDVNLNPLPGF